MPAAIFEPDGDLLIPTDLARGPWTPDALHGGPTAAAVVRAAERHLADDGAGRWQIARLTLELMRPVPVAPLRIESRTSRPGRKVTLVESSVEAGGREVARSVVLAIRAQPLSLPARIVAVPPPPPPDPAGGPAPVPPGAGEWPAFHNAGVEMHFVRGEWREPGPVQVWMRLRVPLVDGEAPSPAVRAAAVADFGNGVSSELEFGSWQFLNPELTVHLARPPVGEWVCLDARTLHGDLGAGVAESALSDADGVFGRAVQSLLFERS